MDKRTILDKAAATEEERLLLSRVWDKYDQCRTRNIPTHTGFLSPHEQAAAENLLHLLAVGEGEAVFWGGYEQAQRKQLHFLPDWASGPDEEALCALRCRYYQGDSLTHRDFLGSLMGLGVTREKVGDILPADSSADAIVGSSLRDFLLAEWTAAGRVALKVEEISLSDLSVPQQQTVLRRDTVASLRLDSVLAVGFSISRSRAAELVRAGRAEVNWQPCDKPDRVVQQGDVLTVRGIGKCTVDEVGGLSKKGRTSVTVKRYI